jgi:7,8-dihydropterin-6-yl-methyl-4-(beta-D-ribofuranosyl)aminobenzene 5'-phosphate synthase
MTASVHALAAERPALVAPAHCTSWLAHHALANALPDAYQPNAVGSRFQLISLDAKRRPDERNHE